MNIKNLKDKLFFLIILLIHHTCYLMESLDINFKDEYDWNLLMIKCRESKTIENKKLIISLINKGIDINHQDKFHGYSALMVACRFAHIDIVKLLINNGANIDIEDYDGNSAIVFCTEISRENIIKLLENCRFINNLIKAINLNDKKTVRLLIKKYDKLLNDKNIINKLLDYAVLEGKLNLIKYLIEKRKINIKCLKNENNKTPWQIAQENGFLKIANYITEYIINLEKEKQCQICLDYNDNDTSQNFLTISDYSCLSIICAKCKFKCENKCPYCRETIE